MTREELVNEIRQLPLTEREAVVEEISRSIREEIQENGSGKEPGDQTSRTEQKLAAVQRLRGMLKTDGNPPTDEEIKEEYVSYLAEKYS
jgi:hypothetical protein